ncbi:hypothetical protein HAX54_044359, partial [Datura stramonium]|nr:hypothetical protein [Datura stramonium]
MRKALRWLPKHLEMRKGVVIDELLQGVENKHRSIDSRVGQPSKLILYPWAGKRKPDGESPVNESITSLRFGPSSMRQVEFHVNQQGPPCKTKYSW